MNQLAYTLCERSQKRGFVNRASARVAKQRHGDRTLRIYRCGHCGLYHLGHVPPALRHGEVSRQELYA